MQKTGTEGVLQSAQQSKCDTLVVLPDQRVKIKKVKKKKKTCWRTEKVIFIRNDSEELGKRDWREMDIRGRIKIVQTHGIIEVFGGIEESLADDRRLGFA